MKNFPRALLGATIAITVAGHAADRADLEGTTIHGNRELPKVLYIVPWKSPVTGALVGKPVESLLDEALAPIDRDVFRRQIEFHSLLHPREVKSSMVSK